MRNLFVKVIFIFLFCFCSVFANNQSQTLKVDEYLKTTKSTYLDFQNMWFISLKNYRNYENMLYRLSNLNNDLEKSQWDGNLVQTSKLKEEIAVLNSSLKLFDYNEKPPFYELFVGLEYTLKYINDTKIKFISFFSNEVEREILKSNMLLESYTLQYKESVEYIDSILQKLYFYEQQNLTEKQKNELNEFELYIKADKQLFDISLDTLKRTYEQIEKKRAFYNSQVKNYVNSELYKFFYVAGSILVIFLLALVTKFTLKRNRPLDKTEEDDQKYFTYKRLINIVFVIITLLIIAFSYIDNVAQALTIFGVVGAGLTIVMKEWVLSFVGWFVLMLSSSIKLGDRIRIDKAGSPIIGDVIDISLTKITLYENITNDALTNHKKAGRIIFVPNYFLITNEVYNYTHYSIQTILDTVEVCLSYDSNFKKAEEIALEIAENITSRYTQMAKRQYNLLRKKYTMRHMLNYPRIFFYPDLRSNGIVLGLWYVSPYREILRHKSEITKMLIESFRIHDDIKLIYSGESVHIEKMPSLENMSKSEVLVDK